MSGEVAFILARLDEWEQAARALAQMPRWVMEHDLPDALPGVVQHIALHDPARVLTQVAALRAVVKHAEQAISQTTMTDATAEAYRTAMEWTLRALARIWAGHPDYPT